jgi:hypothetical protein
MESSFISAIDKLRILQEVRRHLQLDDEVFRELVIKVLRTHMEEHRVRDVAETEEYRRYLQRFQELARTRRAA